MSDRASSFFCLLFLALASACTPASPSQPSVQASAAVSATDLTGIRTYLLAKSADLRAQSSALSASSSRYFDLIESHDFDYADAWQQDPDEVTGLVAEMRQAWLLASPLYEQIEGIVAGVPSLSAYDVLLDAGSTGAEDPDTAAPYDLTLPDGRVLERPGNLFGVTESALWGTWPEFRVDVDSDFDEDGLIEFGETSLPDAGVIRAAASRMDQAVTELQASAEAWEPTRADAFTALVVMVPTMSEYFESWKNSRFVAGDEARQRDFVVISRLADIVDILASLQVVFQSIEPLTVALDPVQSSQVEADLAGLRDFVADVHEQERGGRRYTAEEADLLGAEAQDRATAIAGQIAQIAGRLGVELAE
jgi:hypothetical protein